MFNVLQKVIGTHNERVLKKLYPTVDEINNQWKTFKNLNLEDLPEKTDEFKQRLKEGETLDSLILETFALVKRTCELMLGRSWAVTDLQWEWAMVPFDVQLIGAIVLHQGNIAEMKTGEGKTLAATMPLYLNALTGKGAHLITVNDYLARRDSEWMGPIYEALGLSVGVIQSGMNPEERVKEYSCDITYGTNNEFGFDYLRDNMAVTPEHRVQRGHNYAIVDEVDSVLVDEARTPLIISGAVQHSITRHYDILKPAVENVVHKQTLLVNRFIVEAKQLLKEGNELEAGKKFLQAKRGAPKNKQLLKLLHDPKIEHLIQNTESKYLKEKNIHEVDEDLLFSIDEREHSVNISEMGQELIARKEKENFFTLPDLSITLQEIEKKDTLSPREKAVEKEAIEREYAEKSENIHAVNQLLKAYSLFEKDVEYIVKQGRILIVDEFTGRLMPGRRYSDGLHQALEAKEGVEVERETQTFAQITLQNYFKMYDKLAGMTGTAATEAEEFMAIYELEVVQIPTNEPIRRIDYDDLIYKTKREKYNAIVKRIKELHSRGLPILVGTVSVDISELLSRMLKREGIPHQVLNAKYHEKESKIISHAGEKGQVTIATNMAGRGTDIKPAREIIQCSECCIKPEGQLEHCKEIDVEKCIEDIPCGFHVVGTSRHEARRIDNQLRGRSGRQGDPGASRFFVSLEDDLMRIFATERIASAMDRMGIEEGEPVKHPLISRAIENAQKRVERMNFHIRKRLLEFDDVMNKQREVIYSIRNDILDRKNLKDRVMVWIEDVLYELIDSYLIDKYPEEWDWEGLKADLIEFFLVDLNLENVDMKEINKQKFEEELEKRVKKRYDDKEKIIGEGGMRQFERLIILQVIDTEWRNHLYELDALKEGINLRSFAQKDPLVEYKRESFALFEDLLFSIAKSSVKFLFRFQPEVVELPEEIQGVEVKEEFQGVGAEVEKQQKMQAPKEEIPTIGNPELDRNFKEAVEKMRKQGKSLRDIGRNNTCPCGSGKKFKKCHGKWLR
ncbi:preprotein translocase subunit SecA [candidate division WOR-3 bacterium]|nr:preprotein translocase subunit SecA [candidate division WOR-3 bacterium]MCK4525724.1 preprotein translocase subunit SecA [candidate division WOR-3 bacterium]